MLDAVPLAQRRHDAKGRLDDAPIKIPYDEITCVQFDDRYIDVFYKYVK